jgi:hypothetical protein
MRFAPPDGSNLGPSNLFGALLGLYRPPPFSPYKESGRMGTAVWGGYVQNIERDHRLWGQNRYRTASDIVANVSIVAAGLRFFLNLVAVPTWTVRPTEDLGPGKSSDQAKKAAEFVQDVIDNLDTSWARIVRRSGMFRYHGFGIQEWTARRREDGLIGLQDIEQRPQHTIERWELADDGTIIGMWQRWPQNGQLLFLPRKKVVYLVDDTLTDSPEGMGLFRHLVDPAERLRRYLKMEGMGYERDMRGLPVGRAPLQEIAKAVQDGKMTPQQANTALSGIQQFLQMQVKEEESSILLDSASYPSPNADGYTVSNIEKWDLKLLNSGTQGFETLGKAIDRLTHDMARIIGVESLLLGGQSGSGTGGKALSEDKSRNLYLAVDTTVRDIAEGLRRDAVGAVWDLNGLPRSIMPKLHTSDIAFKDVAVVAKALADMAAAGAIMAPDDPAINDVRDLLEVSRQPDHAGTIAAVAAMLPRATPPKSGAVQPGATIPGAGPLHAAQVDPTAGGREIKGPGPEPTASGDPLQRGTETEVPPGKAPTGSSTPGR